MSKSLPLKFNDISLAYQYMDENIAIIRGQEPDFNQISNDSEVTFAKEPNNPYDKKAVAVYSNNIKLGYVYKGKIQDMINDFIDGSEPIYSFIKDILPSKKKIKLCIGFYRDAVADEPDKVVRIMSSNSADKQDVIMGMSEEDDIDYEYDFEKNKFIAYSLGEEIGFFPKSANDLLQSDPDVFVQEVEYDVDIDRYSVLAAIYSII